MIEIDNKVKLWAEDVYNSIRKNFETQHIYPFEVYPGVTKSTGKAYDKIYWNVWAAANGDQFKVNFFFQYYLYFVDMGVGKGQKIDQVDRSGNASFNQRYKNWKEKGDRQSRPAIMMEFRYQTDRLFRSLADKYQFEAIYSIVHTLESKEGE